MIVCFLGIPFITAYNIISSIFRGLGRFQKSHVLYRRGLRSKYCAGLPFMGAFHLGPVGAALGTTLSQAVSVGVSFLMMKKEKLAFLFIRRTFFRRRQSCSSFFRSGFPSLFRMG
ncbi:MAG: polysaccharide biosynthesis C-terminal domain-containing protein [Blautia sp.]